MICGNYNSRPEWITYYNWLNELQYGNVTRASSKEHGGAEGNTRSEIDILVRNYQKTKLPPRVDFPVKSEPTTLKTRGDTAF